METGSVTAWSNIQHVQKRLSLPVTVQRERPTKIGPWHIKRHYSEGDVNVHDNHSTAKRGSIPQLASSAERKHSLAQLLKQVDEDCALIEKISFAENLWQSSSKDGRDKESHHQRQQQQDQQQGRHTCKSPSTTSTSMSCRICGISSKPAVLEEPALSGKQQDSTESIMSSQRTLLALLAVCVLLISILLALLARDLVQR